MFRGLALYLRMIKFSHSLFALPFAFTAALMAAGGVPSWNRILWISVAMVGARSAAMGMNRVIDRKIDALNPRTSRREIPAGLISVRAAVIFIAISLAAMFYAAYRLNPLCFSLAPVAVAVLFIYSYTKRFTFLSHVVLGIAISGAPLGAWIAIRGSMDVEIMPLAGAVVFWLAGFDILYALQDVDFDRTHGLHSIPQRFGVGKALLISRLCHFLTWLLLLVTGIVLDAGMVYFAGTALVGLLLVYEHSLVREDDISRLDMAFFNMNGYISITVFLFTLADMII